MMIVLLNCTTDEGSCIAAEVFSSIFLLISEENYNVKYTTQSFRTLQQASISTEEFTPVIMLLQFIANTQLK